MCLLIAWVAVAGNVGRGAGILAVAAILLGGTMFARGIPYGALLGVFLWLSGRHRRFAALLGACSLLLFLPYGHLLATYPTLHHVDAAKFTAMALWARNYLLLNPLYLLLSYPGRTVGTTALWIFGALKILVIAAGLLVASRAQRRLLWTLLLFEIATGVLITSGRYATGAPGEISSRYQYTPLLCLAPFVGLVMAWMARPKAVLVVATLLFALGITLPWGRHLDRFAYQRGISVRQAIAATPDDQKFGLPTITAGRARELIAKYGLH
jgi:hypothetical protein